MDTNVAQMNTNESTNDLCVSVGNLCVSVESATNIAGALHLRRIYHDLLVDTLNKKEFEKAVERL